MTTPPDFTANCIAKSMAALHCFHHGSSKAGPRHAEQKLTMWIVETLLQARAAGHVQDPYQVVFKIGIACHVDQIAPHKSAGAILSRPPHRSPEPRTPYHANKPTLTPARWYLDPCRLEDPPSMGRFGTPKGMVALPHQAPRGTSTQNPEPVQAGGAASLDVGKSTFLKC
jgi:hypothetical protein